MGGLEGVKLPLGARSGGLGSYEAVLQIQFTGARRLQQAGPLAGQGQGKTPRPRLLRGLWAGWRFLSGILARGGDDRRQPGERFQLPGPYAARGLFVRKPGGGLLADERQELDIFGSEEARLTLAR